MSGIWIGFLLGWPHSWWCKVISLKEGKDEST